MVNTVCQLCPGGCGIRVRLINGKRAVRLDGNPNNPLNQGGICPLGATGLQYHYGISRIESPLKQKGTRGEVKTLEPITWDEAVALLAAKLKSLRAQPQGLVCLSGKQNGTVSEFFSRFLEAYGSPNYLTMPAAAQAESLGVFLSQGVRTPLSYDFENARMILSFGADLIEGWGAPCRMMSAFRLWRSKSGSQKTRLVQIETRGSLTASQADEWLAVAPGTEAALALGLAHVIVREKIYDRAFVDNYTHGFDDWTDSQGRRHQGFKSMLLEEYTPARVAEITGVQQEKIVELARNFALTKPALAVSGRGQGKMDGSLYEFLAVLSLNALVGSVHRPGGVSWAVTPPLAPWPKVVQDSTSRNGLRSERLDGSGGPDLPLGGHLLYNFLENVPKGKPYPTKMLWVYEANPAHDLADVNLFVKALEKIDTVVSFSSFMDETTVMADLILPAPTFLERFEDVSGDRGLQYAYFGLSRPVLQPRFECRHPGDVLIKLAKMLGGSVAASFPWDNYEEALQARIQGLAAAPSGRVADEPGLQPWSHLGERLAPNYGSADELWEMLQEHGCWYDTSQSMPSLSSAFKTPSGKFEFYCQALKEAGVTGSDSTYLPHYQPADLPGGKEEYPYLLMPYEVMIIENGPLANQPFMTKMLFDFELKGRDSFVEINPKTAKEVGLREGDRVELTTAIGSVKVRLHLTESARPGVIFIPLGLGHSAFDRYIRGKGANANEVLAVLQEPLTGLASWWGTPVKISRA